MSGDKRNRSTTASTDAGLVAQVSEASSTSFGPRWPCRARSSSKRSRKSATSGSAPPASRSRSQQPVDTRVERRGERRALPRPSGPAATCRPRAWRSRSRRSRTSPSRAAQARLARRASRGVRPATSGSPRRSPPRAARGAAPPSSARTLPPGRRPRRRSAPPGSTRPTPPSRPGSRRGQARPVGTCAIAPRRGPHLGAQRCGRPRPRRNGGASPPPNICRSTSATRMPGVRAAKDRANDRLK